MSIRFMCGRHVPGPILFTQDRSLGRKSPRLRADRRWTIFRVASTDRNQISGLSTSHNRHWRGKQVNDVLDRFVGLVVGCFQFAVRTVLWIGFVVKPAVGQRAAELLVEELGVHEPSKRVFIRSVHDGVAVKAITRIPVAYELTGKNLQLLHDEVVRFWRRRRHKPTDSVFP